MQGDQAKSWVTFDDLLARRGSASGWTRSTPEPVVSRACAVWYRYRRAPAGEGPLGDRWLGAPGAGADVRSRPARSVQPTVPRLWGQLRARPGSWVLPDAADRAWLRRAGAEYQVWNPARGEYAVGFSSVRWQFVALNLDVRDRVHGTVFTQPGLVGATGPRHARPAVGAVLPQCLARRSPRG
jgi:hypothetical protein